MEYQLNNQQKAIQEFFGLTKVSPKGWYITKCPFCNKEDHFGIKFTDVRTVLRFNCFKCQQSGSAVKLMTHIGRTDLLQKFVDTSKTLSNQLGQSTYSEEVKVVPRCPPPLGWRRQMSNEYLDSRGFEPWQYERYHIGETKLLQKLKDYVIFLIYQEGENKGYVARIKWSKDQIEKYKSETGRELLRYINESGVDFECLLYGVDEINENTTTIIIVEGITDKTNVDKLIYHNENYSTTHVCVCTFGKKLSQHQINLIPTYLKVVVIYDFDAVKENKKYIAQLYNRHDEVAVGLLDSKDPGELTVVSFENLMCNLHTDLSYVFGVVQARTESLKNNL